MFVRALVLVCAATLVGCGDVSSSGRSSVSEGTGEPGNRSGGADDADEADSRIAGEGGGSGPGVPGPGDSGVPGPVRPQDIDPRRELVLIDLDVVEDPARTLPGGAWSFARLIRNMAGTHDPSEFVMRWLKTWRAEQLVNGYLVPARPPIDIQVIGPWRVRSGCSVTDETCKLDLARSPFRLSAIVYRPNLRSLPDHKGGEGRFVFGVADESRAGHAVHGHLRVPAPRTRRSARRPDLG